MFGRVFSEVRCYEDVMRMLLGYFCLYLISQWGKMLWAFRVRRQLRMDFSWWKFFFLMAHTEWLRHSLYTTHAVHIEDCEGWWLSGCRGSVAEYWGLKPELSWVWLPATALLPFHFPLFRLIRLQIQLSRNQFCIGGAKVYWRSGPKQHYIIMSNKINKAIIQTWYSILYIITWSLVIGGARPPLLDHWGGQWPPRPPWFLLHWD